MADKVQKPCKICGRMFTPCADCADDRSMFRWKRVACSRECARAYFAKIEASRPSSAESLSHPKPNHPRHLSESHVTSVPWN